jgi:hypothetical protein
VFLVQSGHLPRYDKVSNKRMTSKKRSDGLTGHEIEGTSDLPGIVVCLVQLFESLQNHRNENAKSDLAIAPSAV